MFVYLIIYIKLVVLLSLFNCYYTFNGFINKFFILFSDDLILFIKLILLILI